MDHQPSYAAQKAAEEDRLGRALTKQEAKDLKNNTPAVASPRKVHQETSPTYGGRNTPERISSDKKDLNDAGKRDAEIYDQAMKDRGY